MNQHLVNTSAIDQCLQGAIESGIPGLSVAVANSESLLWTGTAGQANLSAGAPARRRAGAN